MRSRGRFKQWMTVLLANVVAGLSFLEFCRRGQYHTKRVPCTAKGFRELRSGAATTDDDPQDVESSMVGCANTLFHQGSHQPNGENNCRIHVPSPRVCEKRVIQLATCLEMSPRLEASDPWEVKGTGMFCHLVHCAQLVVDGQRAAAVFIAVGLACSTMFAPSCKNFYPSLRPSLHHQICRAPLGSPKPEKPLCQNCCCR